MKQYLNKDNALKALTLISAATLVYQTIVSKWNRSLSVSRNLIQALPAAVAVIYLTKKGTK